jgi:hypothetical protein
MRQIAEDIKIDDDESYAHWYKTKFIMVLSLFAGLVFFILMGIYAEKDHSFRLLPITIVGVFFIIIVGFSFALLPSRRSKNRNKFVGNGGKAKENQDNAGSGDNPVEHKRQVRAAPNNPIRRKCHARPHNYPRCARRYKCQFR